MAYKKRTRPDITLQAAIDGFLRHVATAHSPNTLLDYQNTCQKFIAFNGDCLIREITSDEIEDFMIHLRETPIPPTGVTADRKELEPRYRRPKTLANLHVGLSALWTWLTKKGYADEHIVRQVQRPRANLEPIIPLTDAEIVALIHSCNQSRPWHSKPLVTNYRSSAERDKAIVAAMAETAIRVSELCNLRYRHLSFIKGGGSVFVDLGKGSKSREVPFSRRCASLLSDYLLTRPGIEGDDWLFITVGGRYPGQKLNKNAVLQLVKKLGRKIDVHVTPHKLRTTAACMMASNGMSAFELQRIMGHADIKTTRRYVEAANLDLQKAMRRASPLDNLKL